MFDCERPTVTDPYVGKELKWAPSTEPCVYYFWSQPVPIDFSFAPEAPPATVDCEHGNTLEVYSTFTKIELLYRLKIVKEPKRFLCRPFDHALFWTYGSEGGPSRLIKYLYRDRNLSINKWVDKDSFLSVVRTNHFAHYDMAFWSR